MLSCRSLSLPIHSNTTSIYFLTSFILVLIRLGFSGIAISTLLIFYLVGVDTLESSKAGIFNVSSSESNISLNFKVRLVLIGSLLVPEEQMDFPDVPEGASSGDIFLRTSGVLKILTAS